MVAKIALLVPAIALCVVSTACKKSAPTAAPAAPNPEASGGAGETDQASTANVEPTTRPGNPSIKAPPPGPPMVVRGVTINVDKGEQALRGAPYSVYIYLDNVRRSLYREDFDVAIMDYEKIMQDPGVNENQKSVIQGIIEQVKQAASAPAK